MTFPPQERGRAFSFIGLTAGLAAVAGPILGGLLIGGHFFGLDWRPIFLVNIPVGVVAIAVGWRLIPRTLGHPDLKNDYLGILLFGLATVALVFPLIEGRAYGWPLWAWALIAAALVFAGLFVLWERRMASRAAPQLLNFSLISNGNFLLGVLITAVFFSGIPSMFLVTSLLLQEGYGFTALDTGLTYTPFSIGVMLVSVFIGRLGQKYLRGRVAVGAALLTIGIGWLNLIIRGLGDAVDAWSLLPPLLIAGIGLGMGFSGLFPSVLSGVPARDAGAGSGALQAFQQVGVAIGVALVGEIFFAQLDGAFASGDTPQTAFASAAGLALLYQVASFALVVGLVPFLKIQADEAGPGQARAAAPAEA